MITLFGNIYKTNIKANADEVRPYKTIFNVNNREYIN